ncbi:MAG: hypothetical protein WCT07_02215 [Candidatus Paceibacterota bacterium]|jgi:hypothetical protein
MFDPIRATYAEYSVQKPQKVPDTWEAYDSDTLFALCLVLATIIVFILPLWLMSRKRKNTSKGKRRFW